MKHSYPLGGSRTVLQYKIHESIRKPHFMDTENKSRECFIRVEDKSIKASREVTGNNETKTTAKEIFISAMVIMKES